MTAFNHLHRTGTSHHLIQHFGKPETTLVTTDRWLVATAEDNRARGRVPDLLIAFNVRPDLYESSNGYIISEQGKPPDFVIEVASVTTAEIDVTEKRDDYEAMGIPEYWRFDQTGQFHGTRLAGDRLVEGRYEPITIETREDGSLQGYSAALDLYLRWDNGELVFVDPATEASILTYEDQKVRADQAEARANAADERARQLEEEVRRLRGE